MCEGHSHSSQGFSNDRVDVWELITHDPGAAVSSLHPSLRGQTASCFSLCFFTKYIVLDAHCEKEMSPQTGANTSHCHSFFPLSSCMHPLVFPFLHHLFLSLFLLTHHSSQTLLNCLSVSRNKSAVNALPLIFFFLLLVGRSFQGYRVLLWPGVLSGSHWSAGNREHKGSRACFKWGVGGCRGCGGGNQFSLRIAPSFTCASR